jgi:hypothetical protein
MKRILIDETEKEVRATQPGNPVGWRETRENRKERIGRWTILGAPCIYWGASCLVVCLLSIPVYTPGSDELVPFSLGTLRPASHRHPLCTSLSTIVDCAVWLSGFIYWLEALAKAS